jgi:hypothetical protein
MGMGMLLKPSQKAPSQAHDCDHVVKSLCHPLEEERELQSRSSRCLMCCPVATKCVNVFICLVIGCRAIKLKAKNRESDTNVRVYRDTETRLNPQRRLLQVFKQYTYSTNSPSDPTLALPCLLFPLRTFFQPCQPS